MGILDFFFGKDNSPKKPAIHDDFFGDLEYIDCKPDASKSVYSGARYFEPVQDNVAIHLLAGNGAGPTLQQKDFYKSIEANYPAITQNIIPLLEDTFGNFQEGFKINDFNAEFAIVNISLPLCNTMPIAWEIAYETIHDDNHVFTVLMRDLTATDIQIDG